MSASDAASLRDRLSERIAATGPLALSDFMEACLHDDPFGYYASQVQLAHRGARGDFVTAPEISQMFGEMIGLWIADSWQRIGRPTPFFLVELGPGRGTLMQDILRVTRKFKDFRQACRLVLLETSPILRDVQKQNLSERCEPALACQWVRTMDEIPSGPMMLIANEFLDCLPVDHWFWDGEYWTPNQVDVDPEGSFIWRRGSGQRQRPAGIPPDLPATSQSAPDEIIEARAADRQVLVWLAERFALAPGLALFLDYGKSVSGAGATVQGLRAHQQADLFDEPGSVDVSAWVDFQALSQWATELGLTPQGPVPQGVFLRDLGITARAQRLAQQNPTQSSQIQSAFIRLTSAQQMGALFKVICLGSADLPPLAGFSAASDL